MLKLIVLALMVACVYSNEEVDPLGYLSKYGYLSFGYAKNGGFSDAVKAFQKMARIPQTGKIDEATKLKMAAKRCGNKDKMGLRTRRSQSTWKKFALTYSYDNYAHELGKAETRRIITQAFKMWSDVTPLTFTEVRSKGDIIIRFEAGKHGCHYGFDGPGGTLAHAFYPENGDAHFDEDEKFTDKEQEDGVRLLYVAAHEFGHSLGLGHTNVYEALMYPMYKALPGTSLPEHDTNEIQRLYGDETATCSDDPRHVNGECKSWEKAGYCQSKADTMNQYCKKTCGFCCEYKLHIVYFGIFNIRDYIAVILTRS